MKKVRTVEDSNPEVSIVMAYYNRLPQTLQTLKTIQPQPLHYTAEVIIVDDGSSEEHDLEPHIKDLGLDITLIKISPNEKWWTNPCIPYNIGFREAKGRVVVIQNPECAHVGDLIMKAFGTRDDEYLSFHCYSLNEEDTEYYLRTGEYYLADKAVGFDGDSGYYNHEFFRPRALHFCSAITKKTLDEIGGFDEDYANGIAFDDDDFVRRVLAKGLDIKFIDKPFVLHQHHYSEGYKFFNADRQALIQDNQKIFRKKW